MNDILRTFRLGTINLLGVTIPGLMFLLLLGFGFVAPSIYVVADRLEIHESLAVLRPVHQISSGVAVAIFLIVAYVIGYIFRLSTPDDLDKKSADIVLRKMKKAKGNEHPEKDHWPYRGEEDNKFPYFHFRDYLIHRRHLELAEEVEWDKDVRSKTFVNKMKFETALRSQQLSAIIESNEAHVRLMFGTWLAFRFTLWPGVIGFLLVATSIATPLFNPPASPVSHETKVAFLLWFAITGLLLLANRAASARIESLFHYRRVRELFDIIACYSLAKKQPSPTGQILAPSTM